MYSVRMVLVMGLKSLNLVTALHIEIRKQGHCFLEESMDL